MTQTMDGSYYADGRTIYRRPKRSKTGITLGFQVCIVSEYLSDDAADLIVAALNAYDPPSKED